MITASDYNEAEEENIVRTLSIPCHSHLHL